MNICMRNNEIDAKPDENCEIVTDSDLTDDIEETAFNRNFNNKSDGDEQMKRIEERIPSARKQTCNILTRLDAPSKCNFNPRNQTEHIESNSALRDTNASFSRKFYDKHLPRLDEEC